MEDQVLPEEQQAVFRLGLEGLLRLSRVSGERRTHSVATLKAWFQKREEHLYRTVPRIRQGSLQRPIDSTMPSLDQERPLLVWTHGDFWPANLLSTAGSDRLTGIVDWEFADSEGMPLIDLLQLLLYTKGRAIGKGFGYLLAERLSVGRFENDERRFIEEYCAELDVSSRAIWPLTFMAWLDWVYRRSSIHGYLPSWQRNEIDGFLEVVGKLPAVAV